MSESLYFIAIVPPEKIQNLVTEIKNDVATRFGSTQALKSPGHITLHMPFRWKDKKKNQLMDVIEDLNNSISPFEVELKDFGFFEPRVVFINVCECQALRDLQKLTVQKCRTELKLLNSNYKDQVFRPHMTVAFRDLKKTQFFEAKQYFSELHYHNKFTVDSITLLKHGGKRWNLNA